ncbi:metal-dependent hydrolase [Ramlibacter montanisoli]|uniref:metal-dependent hydrolase n=1 Tax=Ramlibacter montanisoli TaxID=2732512 RepID=UPI002815C24F|nr:metal-dependent hydrolase [Ramlibacter montanisoli]
MDSISQIALGAAVGIATMGRRTALWKAALWGGIAGTLPDLDVVIDHGDALRNMTMHRGASHSLFWLSVVSPLMAALPAAVHRERPLFTRWWLAMWLALVTHPLLDAMTVYGTRLLLPFSDHPFAVGSVFIIDPLYTVPLLVGVGIALSRRDGARLRWNGAGLALSTAYLAWSVVAQAQVRDAAQEALAAQGGGPATLLVTPTPSTPCCGGWWRSARTAATGKVSARCSTATTCAGAARRGAAPAPGARRHRGRAAAGAFLAGLLQIARAPGPRLDHRPAHGPGAALHLLLRGGAPQRRRMGTGAAAGRGFARRRGPRPRMAVAAPARARHPAAVLSAQACRRDSVKITSSPVAAAMAEDCWNWWLSASGTSSVIVR